MSSNPISESIQMKLRIESPKRGLSSVTFHNYFKCTTPTKQNTRKKKKENTQQYGPVVKPHTYECV